MLRITRTLGAVLLVCFPALAADQVVLTNGDTISGTIVKKDGGKLTMKSEFLGEVLMPWTAVKSIRSEAELNVVLPPGETVKGKIASVGDQLQVAAGGQTRSAPLTAISAIRDAAEQRTFERLLDPGLLELWTGNFDIGFALARGNARTDTLSTAFSAVRATRHDKVALHFNQIRGSARVDNVTSTIASAVRGGWKYNRNFSPHMFASGFNDYEHDRFQNLDIRFVAGGGLGVRAAQQEHAQLDFDAGVDYQRENFLDGVRRNSAEVNLGDSAVYQLSKATSLTQSLRMFANLTNLGVYRLNFDIASNTLLKKWLGWNVSASDRYNSNPVQPKLRNDVLVSTGFRITFAK